MTKNEQLLAWRRVLVERGINLGKVETLTRIARGNVVDWQIERVLHYRDESFRLFNEGEALAASWAAQAMWEASNGLHNALEGKRAIRAGRRVIEGGKKGALKTNDSKGEGEKRALVIMAIKSYKGQPRNMASIVAKKCGCSARYVRDIKKEVSLP